MTNPSGARGPSAFPPTRLSVLGGARAADPAMRARSLEILARGYWAPVYKHLRLRWRKPKDDAEELTQAFFTAAIEKDFFGDYDATKGRFRTFVRVCVDRFASDDRKASQRIKRGGGLRPLSFDVASAEAELATAGDDVESVFDRELKRSLFRLALTSLRAELSAAGRTRHLEVFERYDLASSDARPSYEEIATALGIKVTDVTNSLSYARRAFRRHVLLRLREICVSEEEYESEAGALGVAPADT